MGGDRVELSIMCAPADLAFLEPTLRHQLATFAGSADIDHRVLVADFGNPRAERAGELEALGARLLGEGLIDEVRPVAWDEATQADTMGRWYGQAGTAWRAARGRAVYQYAFSVDTATRPLVLHLDSDVLFHGDGAWWVRQAVDALVRREDVGGVVANGALPRANTLREWILGPGAHRRRWENGFEDAFDISSRGVLLHRERLMSVLPLRRSDPSEQWEKSVSDTLRAKGFFRTTLIDDRFYMVHPLRHSPAHARGIERLVSLVESGRIPFRRFGEPWDITTGSWRFAPWWLSMRRAGRT